MWDRIYLWRQLSPSLCLGPKKLRLTRYCKTSDEESVYIELKVKLAAGPDYGAQAWDGTKLMDLIEAFESDARNRLVTNLGRTSPYPRILPLRDLLKTRISK